MEMVIFSGIQAAGKTTFYEQRFRELHQHLCLDILKTRKREDEALRAMIAAGSNIVVDSTNPTSASRDRFISVGRAAGYRIVGYQFNIAPRLAIARNGNRANRVPDIAIWATVKRMTELSYQENFDEIHIVESDLDMIFKTRFVRTR